MKVTYLQAFQNVIYLLEVFGPYSRSYRDRMTEYHSLGVIEDYEHTLFCSCCCFSGI